MNKFVNFSILILLLLLITACSFDNRSGIWKKHNKKIIAEANNQKKTEKIFKKKELFKEEFQSGIKIELNNINNNNYWIENNLNELNQVGHLVYSNNKNRIFKSKQIGKTNFLPSEIVNEPLFIDGNIYFNDLTGNIYKYSINKKKVVWKYNFYKKKFKNIPIRINLKLLSESLIVSDSLGYFYNLELKTGKLIWAKNQGVPLTSEIKSYDSKIFLLNQDNKFYIFDKNSGKKIIDFETFPVILKKNNKQTLAIDTNNNIYFVTSAGQIFSLNFQSYKINWLKNIKAESSDEYGLFFSSPIIVKEKNIFLSSSQSTQSFDSISGKTLWSIPLGTRIRPIVSNQSIFLITEKGFALSANIKTGEILWSRKLFKNQELKLNKIGKVTSIFLLSNQILVTTKNGYFFFLNHNNGKIINFSRVAKGFYSKPIVANGKIYIINNKMKILVFG